MNLFKSTTTFSFFTLISRILGYIRDILIAIFLGSGPLADAFFVAFRIPNTFRRLFSEGTFNSAFVPSYASELSRGEKKSENFASSIFSILVFGLFFIVLLMVFFSCTEFFENTEMELNEEVQLLNKFDLEPLENYLIFGKGPGQDGAINPYAKYIKSDKGYLISSKDCYSIIENLGTSGFSIRIQKDGRIIKTIPIKKNETKKILLDAGNELYTDASFEGRAKFKVTFEDVSF